MPSKRILLVGCTDDEFRDLLAVRRDGDGWDFAYAADGEEMLESMQAGPAEIVVCSLPEVEGIVERLGRLKARWPFSMRIVLSPPAPLHELVGLLAVAHQVLRRPCDPALLRQAVAQALSLVDLATDPDMAGTMEDGLEGLPTLPKAYWHLVEAMHDPRLGVQDIAGTVEANPTLSAKVLARVNSSYFGLDTPITSVRQAVGYLGPASTADLALSSAVQQALRGDLHEWQPVAVDRTYLKVAPVFRDPNGRVPPEQAALMALVHDIGMLLFSLCVSEDAEAPLGASGGPKERLCLKGIWACEETL